MSNKETGRKVCRAIQSSGESRSGGILSKSSSDMEDL